MTAPVQACPAGITLLAGDSREVLKGLADNSVDAIVCDPPYGLSGRAPCAAVLSAWLMGREFGEDRTGFMGKAWDGFVPGPAVWRECLRVLKPGGYLLAFFGSRTEDLGSIAIRLAGFERRDMIAWLYGSGFPKSLDISKAIAKRRLEDVEPVRVICRIVRAAMDERGLKSRDLVSRFGDCHPRLIDHWAARNSDSQPSLPTPEQWRILREVLGLAPVLDLEVDRLNRRKGEHGERWTGAEVVGEVESSPAGFGDLRFDGDRTIRALDDEAAEWEGWGTMLKPALEPIVFAQKPLGEGTYAANVLKHGVGALNVDGCRVEGESTERRNTAEMGYHGGNLSGDYATGSDKGRWPANVVHDGSADALAAFPGDADGSAARFFYSAKADAADRFGTIHSTVKPVDLMAWLCRLVTPPGGVVLDPFAGSGTTGVAALAEGLRAILIERDPAHMADIRTRFEHLAGGGGHSAQVKRRHKAAAPPVGGLFGDDNSTTQGEARP